MLPPAPASINCCLSPGLSLRRAADRCAGTGGQGQVCQEPSVHQSLPGQADGAGQPPGGACESGVSAGQPPRGACESGVGVGYVVITRRDSAW